MKITDFDIKISPENVCAFLDADKTGELYEEILEELEEMLPQAYDMIRPAALLEFGSLEGYSLEADGKKIKEALFGIYTVGERMSTWSAGYFAEGDYLRGMLADAIADDCLFQMDRKMEQTVISLCRKKGRGIAGRAEAPQDIPMSVQKRAWEVTRASEEGIGITGSYMYDPVKTVCQVYLLDENTKRYHPEHDCSRCPNVACRRRMLPSVQITVMTENGEITVSGRKKDSLLTTLREHDIFIPAVCAGRGVCGKCAVRFVEGVTPVTEKDKLFFTKEKLEEGYRLSCCAYPQHSCTVVVNESVENRFFVLTDDADNGLEESAPSDMENNYGIAADIGTTTIAMQMIRMPEMITAGVYTDINRQRAYGADVISRIEASNTGKKEELKNSIRRQLKEGITSLTKDKDGVVKQMIIGGNTAMIHLLMGYSCETLGVYPFTPVNISAIHTSYGEMFGKGEYDFDITICPGISAYVGGDITAGLYALDFDKMERPCALIDLGTNGEMAVGCRDKLLVTSTAAGPAFEGGNIVCGTGSIPGAVCGVDITGDQVKLRTIGDEVPSGICGTGVIEAVYELKKSGIIDETGLMEEPYFDEGFLLYGGGTEIRLYQKDIREIQLAKSAVRSGFETLLLRYGITYNEIDRIYIAGGFGHQMNAAKAADIGLLPKECLDRITAAGNTCLRGITAYLSDDAAELRMRDLAEKAEEVQLSNDRQFQELYMEYMYFE